MRLTSVEVAEEVLLVGLVALEWLEFELLLKAGTW
jgi:hypothetical protein